MLGADQSAGWTSKFLKCGPAVLGAGSAISELITTDYSQWEYDCAVVRLVVTSMMYVQFMYNVRGYLSTLPLALKSEGAKRQIMPFHKQKAF